MFFFLNCIRNLRASKIATYGLEFMLSVKRSNFTNKIVYRLEDGLGTDISIPDKFFRS